MDKEPICAVCGEPMTFTKENKISVGYGCPNGCSYTVLFKDKEFHGIDFMPKDTPAPIKQMAPDVRNPVMSNKSLGSRGCR